MTALHEALRDAGGVHAPAGRAAQLRELLVDELEHSARELAGKRSGYGRPVTAAFACAPDGTPGVVALLPLDPRARADPAAASDRAWAVASAACAALVACAGLRRAASVAELALQAGSWAGWLALVMPARDAVEASELAALSFAEQLAGVDRLRAAGAAVPAAVAQGVEDLRRPLDPAHPLLVAEALARLGASPADPQATGVHEEEVAALFGSAFVAQRPHRDPDPALRAARRILQRLAGMGKWGGFHTEFAHLYRGFDGAERAFAREVGERLVAAGLLVEKTSVGQRHVSLNPRRARDVYLLRDEGVAPPGLELPPERG